MFLLSAGRKYCRTGHCCSHIGDSYLGLAVYQIALLIALALPLLCAILDVLKSVPGWPTHDLALAVFSALTIILCMKVGRVQPHKLTWLLP